DALIEGFPASEKGQYDFLKALEKSIAAGGGEGLIYWEPAWVSTSCRTQWGQGSHWDNATLFNHNYKVTEGMKYYSGK
ncbi:MAG: glycosyl hydrolase 53 family protein, partial [Saprospiraceae bacterium]|nr:glycosyl hydrolase 53 family protein [Saprospiraceae bacterium]